MMMTPQNARIWYISPKEPHNKTAYFVDAVRSIKSAHKLSPTGRKSRRHCALFARANPYIPDDFSLIKSEKKYDIQS